LPDAKKAYTKRKATILLAECEARQGDATTAMKQIQPLMTSDGGSPAVDIGQVIYLVARHGMSGAKEPDACSWIGDLSHPVLRAFADIGAACGIRDRRLKERSE